MAKLLRRKVIEETYEIPGEDDDLDGTAEAENDDEELDLELDDDEDDSDAEGEDEDSLAGVEKPTRKSSRTTRR